MNEQRYGAILGVLAHHGVRGQRWGVRRTKAALARAARREGREVSPESARTQELLKKKRSELTNPELKELNERLQLEKTNKQLNPNAISRGRTKTLAVLGTIGTVGGFLNSPPGKAAIKAGKIAVSNLILNKIPVPMK